MKPTGVISVRSRRKSGSIYYSRRKLNYRRCPDHLDVVLRPDDIVVVQFDVNSGRPKKKKPRGERR